MQDPDVLTAEAMAVRDGLLLAHQGGFDAVILESDNLESVSLWHEIRELSRVFNSFSISFVTRDINEAAHHCAKLLLSMSSQECVWTETSPTTLVGIAFSDCNPASE
jgi:hypothetical protein